MKTEDTRLVWFIEDPSARIWSVNPYKACGNRCVYCIARSQGRTEPWFSADLVTDELKKRLVQVPADAELFVGALVDAYPPEELDLRITRAVLWELSRQDRSFCISTKSDLVQHDSDILINHAGHCDVYMSICTLDESIISRLEPNAPSVANRLQAVSALSLAGVDINIDASPWIPRTSDIGALLDVLPAEVNVQVAPLSIEHTGTEAMFAGMDLSQDFIDSEYRKERERVGSSTRIRWK